jgi:peptidoglycan/LPS O-acetylase OafA/YrhL
MMVSIMHWGLELGPERMLQVYELPVIGFLIENGGLGVDIFFLISGYVIFETAMRKDSLDFIVARFIRLFPALLISMSIVAIVSPRIVGNYQFSINSYFHSIFLSYQAANVQPLATQLWTLIFEIKFYGAVAIILLLFPRIFRSVKGVITLLILWQVVIMLFLPNFSSLSSGQMEFFSLGKSGILFATGICLNLLSNNYRGWNLGTISSYLATLYFSFVIYKDSYYGFNSAILILVSAMLIVLARHISLNRVTSKILKYAGLSSYLIYLLHEHLGMAFVMFFQEHFTRNLFVLLFTSSVFITTASLVIAIFLESPIQEYLKGKSQLIPQKRVAL